MQSPTKGFFIDDDEDDRDFFCTAIQSIESNVDCRFAKDGSDAILQLKSDSSFIPDFIFIDMNMPMMDGKECYGAILEIDRLRNVPVYIYSTSSTPELVAEIMNMGARDFLLKPSSMGELESLLREVLYKTAS